MLIRNFAWHFALKGQRQKIRERILKTVMEAQREADVIGLGALTKAESCRSEKGCKDVLPAVPGQQEVHPGASFTMQAEFVNAVDGDIHAVGRQQIVYADMVGRPKRLPQELKELLMMMLSGNGNGSGRDRVGEAT